jgi:hypothetical protein
MRTWRLVSTCCLALAIATCGQAKQLYADDFEGTAVGDLPAGWEKLWDGTTTASVIKDPVDGANRALTSSDLAEDASRHDVGGSIHGVGDVAWTDYIVEYDALFPADFYMGTLFRYQDDTNFHLLDRRSAGELGTFSFYHHTGAWTNFGSGEYLTDVDTWYSFRIDVKGDTFTVYIGTPDEREDFSSAEPVLEGTNPTLENGKFALYGLIYIDNLIIGETEADMTLAVDSRGKLTTSWAELKR